MMNLIEKVEELEKEASDFGFRWESPLQIIEQIQSECLEVLEHIQQDPAKIKRAELQDEIGDLMHAVFCLCIFCKFNPHETLKKTLQKFERRLKAVKNLTPEQGLNTLERLSVEQLMEVWEKAKKQVG